MNNYLSPRIDDLVCKICKQYSIEVISKPQRLKEEFVCNNKEYLEYNHIQNSVYWTI